MGCSAILLCSCPTQPPLGLKPSLKLVLGVSQEWLELITFQSLQNAYQMVVPQSLWWYHNRDLNQQLHTVLQIFSKSAALRDRPLAPWDGFQAMQLICSPMFVDSLMLSPKSVNFQNTSIGKGMTALNWWFHKDKWSELPRKMLSFLPVSFETSFQHVLDQSCRYLKQTAPWYPVFSVKPLAGSTKWLAATCCESMIFGCTGAEKAE